MTIVSPNHPSIVCLSRRLPLTSHPQPWLQAASVSMFGTPLSSLLYLPTSRNPSGSQSKATSSGKPKRPPLPTPRLPRYSIHLHTSLHLSSTLPSLLPRQLGTQESTCGEAHLHSQGLDLPPGSRPPERLLRVPPRPFPLNQSPSSPTLPPGCGISVKATPPTSHQAVHLGISFHSSPYVQVQSVSKSSVAQLTSEISSPSSLPPSHLTPSSLTVYTSAKAPHQSPSSYPSPSVHSL